MFRKKIDVKASTLLKTSEKKKFRSLVAVTFFKRHDDSIAKESQDDDDTMPSDIRSSLVKGEVALTKAVAENGKQFEFYTLDKTPVFFLENSRLYPTVYLSWMVPSALPRIYTHAEVVEKLKTGADLMLPGVITSAAATTSFDFPEDAVCAICVVGNDAAMAIGRTLMSGAEMLTCDVKKGRAVQVLHTYQDHLWELGPKTRAPTINLPKEHDDVEPGDASGNDPVDALSDSVGDSLIVDDAHPSEPTENNGPSTTLAEDNDTLFLLYFLYALQKKLRRDDDLPLLASTFYGSVLLPLMPPNEGKITIQQTSFKKFSTFLRRMQEDGLIVIDEPKKGVENIAKIVRNHEFFSRYADQLKQLPTADKIQEPADASSSTVNERPVNFRELRAITAPVLPLFHEVNKSLKKGQALSAADVRSVITSYVKSKELANGRMVKLDDLLLKCTVASSNDQRAVGDSVAWELVMETVFNKMTPCIEIEYTDSGAGAAGSRKEVRKGKPPTIRMKVAKRAGNKKVTMIDNVQEFGIDPKSFAQELQVALAVSATLNDAPGSATPQVQVQGDQSAALQKILTEKYGISKKYIQLLDIGQSDRRVVYESLTAMADVLFHLTVEQIRLINDQLRNTVQVATYIHENGGMHKYHMDTFVKKSSPLEQRQFFVDYLNRRGMKEFDLFVDALVHTRQLELAKGLKPTLNLDVQQHSSGKSSDPGASGDGNCMGGGFVIGGDEETSAESNESLILEPPSPTAIQENESYYRAENKVYIDIPETDGFLSDLKVVISDKLPTGFDLDKCYPHFSNPKGLALIFNNRRFRRQRAGIYNGQPLPERIGTDVDCKNLDRLLTGLGYQVHIKTDLTAQEMLDAMSRFSFKSEHNKCHSTVVVVLTHGTHGQIYGADEQLIEIKRFVSFLNGQNCPALKNKPKIFIIQACRGDHYDEGVDGPALGIEGIDGGATGDNGHANGDANLARLAVMRRLAEMDETDAKNIAKTPTDADILIAYATTPGYVSWRNTVRGSWFVQAICEVFAKEAYCEEILHLFTLVNSKVAQQLSGTGHMQVPEPSSRLTKKFYLLPGL